VTDFLPSAPLETLRIRAALLTFTRRFFDQAGYLEVETPLLSPDVVVDAHLEPFATRFRPDPASDAGGELFLQTSPEFSLKRLLAAGSGPVFEVFRAFRNGEAGRLHNPEFTLIEWYRPGDDHLDQMTFTEGYVRAFFRKAADLLTDPSIQLPSPWGEGPGARGAHTRTSPLAPEPTPPRRPRPAGLDGPFDRLTYDAAFERHAGTRVLHLSTPALADLAASRGVPAPPGLPTDDTARDEWLNLLLAELVEPHLGVERPTFLYDYPASQAALAVIRREAPPVAERFELYVAGVELCNGYHELLDADELRRRNREQNAKRRDLGLRTLPEDSRLLAAMDHGLPASSGVALGFDRLLMVALGRESIGEVRAFLTENGRTGERENGEY
jgi:lysyl-tRNA synthetase class 2